MKLSRLEPVQRGQAGQEGYGAPRLRVGPRNSRGRFATVEHEAPPLVQSRGNSDLRLLHWTRKPGPSIIVLNQSAKGGRVPKQKHLSRQSSVKKTDLLQARL